jgi:hypothetical protein
VADAGPWNRRLLLLHQLSLPLTFGETFGGWNESKLLTFVFLLAG